MEHALGDARGRGELEVPQARLERGPDRAERVERAAHPVDRARGRRPVIGRAPVREEAERAFGRVDRVDRGELGAEARDQRLAVPAEVAVTPVPDSAFVYANLNGDLVLIDAETRQIVQVVR